MEALAVRLEEARTIIEASVHRCYAEFHLPPSIMIGIISRVMSDCQNQVIMEIAENAKQMMPTQPQGNTGEPKAE